MPQPLTIDKHLSISAIARYCWSVAGVARRFSLDAKAEAWLSHERGTAGVLGWVVPPALAFRSLGFLGAAGSRAWWRWRTRCRWR